MQADTDTPLIPRATYRLQFNRSFRFSDAAGLAPYLAALGVSHVYASPLFKARPGSAHGYDVTDHNDFNPEIGSAGDFARMSAAFRARGLQLMLDIVPNHMGVMGADNHWWLDVLENGPASPFAAWFDIDWDPPSEDLRGKLLIPVLGAQYGTILEAGELRLVCDAGTGSFRVEYHQHHFPLDPRSYATILEDAAAGLPGDAWGGLHAMHAMHAMHALAAGFASVPGRGAADEAARANRAARVRELKHRLAALLRDDVSAAASLGHAVDRLNGRVGQPGSFDALHALIKVQAWRLAHWRVAAHDINYRRFFDVAELAALRMEHAELFGEVHRLAFRLLAEGHAAALRIDHPDGLYDPAAYFSRLQQLAPAPRGRATPGLPVYLVIEKILAADEPLPAGWAVHGTTGYRFLNQVNGLFVDTAAAARMGRVHAAFSGPIPGYADVLHESKLLIMNHALEGELGVLANMLGRIARSDRHTCDFPLESLRRTLREVVACFPVYRTYVTALCASATDREHIMRAVTAARRRSRAAEPSVFEFVAAALCGDLAAGDTAARTRLAAFIGRFQQYTAPVTAKAMEDTAFYRYLRLVSLNEVGGDPQRFGVTPAAFHAACAQRARQWPHTLLATSTHDSKRSEDVRARIDVLSEMPVAWRLALRRWRQINRRSRRAGTVLTPSRNDEYLLYQTLLGTWPQEDPDDAGLAAYRERIQAYMLKAAREAKLHTSWMNPDAAYESALAGFIDRLLGRRADNAFLDDLQPWCRLIAHHGLLNSLGQTLIKCTAPGVPDIYQGNELFDFSLVDPDNRRAVDYASRARRLALVEDAFGQAGNCATAARALLQSPADGRAKLYVLWRLLQWRRRHPDLFAHGDYQPLSASGPRAAHVFAFARHHDSGTLVTVVPRLCYRLARADGADPMEQRWPMGAIWGSTKLELPGPGPWQQLLTGSVLESAVQAADIGMLLQDFPVAALYAAGR